METARKELVGALEKERDERKMDNHTFSTTLLKISESYWSMLRSGDRRFSIDMLQTILFVFPHLEPQVIAYMKDGDEEE